MNDAAIQALASQIAQQQLIESWPYALALVALSAVVGSLSNYAVSYLRKRGETRALRADLEELLRQSKAITSATEEVKTSISQNAWASREARTIRRAKLEDLILAVHELFDWLGKRRDFVVHGIGPDPGKSPLNQAVLLATLYFPEILLETKKLRNIQLVYDVHQLETAASQRGAADDALAKSRIADESASRSRELFQECLVAADELSTKCSALMQEILGT